MPPVRGLDRVPQGGLVAELPQRSREDRSSARQRVTYPKKRPGPPERAKTKAASPGKAHGRAGARTTALPTQVTPPIVHCRPGGRGRSGSEVRRSDALNAWPVWRQAGCVSPRVLCIPVRCALRYRRSPRPLEVQGCSAGTDTSHSWLPSSMGSSVNSCEHPWF